MILPASVRFAPVLEWSPTIMVNSAESTTCLACGSPIVQIAGRGHRKRLYCDDLCRQRAHRSKGQENVTIDMNGDLQEHIAELEHELAAAHALMDKYTYRKRVSSGWKQILQERFLQLGKAADWPALTIPIRVQSGERAHRVFALAASNDLLSGGSVALRNRNQS